jgi:hypothetical protein
MEQIKNSPEIAPSDLSELMESVAAADNQQTSASILSVLTPKPAAVKKAAAAGVTTPAAAVSNAAAPPLCTNSAPPVLKRPVKLADGTPLKRDRLTAAGAVTTPAASGDSGGGVKRRASKRMLEEESANGKAFCFCFVLFCWKDLEIMCRRQNFATSVLGKLVSSKETGHLWLYYIYMTVFIRNAANLAHIPVLPKTSRTTFTSEVFL